MNKSELLAMIKRVEYITPLRYVSGRIVEYDIRSANITMLMKQHMLSDQQYEYISKLPKENREIYIGQMIRSDKNFYKVIRDGINKAKLDLFNANKIDPYTVIRIANDAVYINSFIDLSYTEFEDVIFKIKSISSVMMRIGNLVILYWYDQNGINLNVIGMQKTQYLHANYMGSVIGQVIYYLERVSTKEALNFICSFYEDYVNLRIDREYYREFNPESMYRYKNSTFYISYIEDLNDIDIGYNLYILREIYSIVLEKYNEEMKGGI